MISIGVTEQEAELLRSALLMKMQALDDMIYFYNDKNGKVPDKLKVDREQVFKIMFKLELAINEK